MNPIDGSNGLSHKRQTSLKQENIKDYAGGNLHQICPRCKKLVLESDLICPNCNEQLSSQYEQCPFCKNQISEKDNICPHCGELLIYELPKKVTANRNRVLFPLGLLLLISMLIISFLSWKGIELNRVIYGVFLILWLVGFALFGAYMGKGDKDFWWGK